MGTPTRFPGGISLIEVGALKNFPIPVFHQDWLVDYNDFFTYNAGDWTVTETQAGATQALLDEQGGILRLGNSAADDDLNSIQKVGESWKLVAGKKTIFEARVRCSEATQTDLFLGLAITDTSPIASAPTDCIGFRKDDGDAFIDFVSLKNSAGTTATAVGTLVAATMVKLGFYFNGFDLFGYINDAQVFKVDRSTLVFVDDEELRITFSQQNGDAVARNFDIDYYAVAQEMAR